jgi:hypothetical protein
VQHRDTLLVLWRDRGGVGLTFAEQYFEGVANEVAKLPTRARKWRVGEGVSAGCGARIRTREECGPLSCGPARHAWKARLFGAITHWDNVTRSFRGLRPRTVRGAESDSGVLSLGYQSVCNALQSAQSSWRQSHLRQTCPTVWRRRCDRATVSKDGPGSRSWKPFSPCVGLAGL